jgi:NTE family protein
MAASASSADLGFFRTSATGGPSIAFPLHNGMRLLQGGNDRSAATSLATAPPVSKGMRTMVPRQRPFTTLSRDSSHRRPVGVTFVLSGGASRGALQVGMLQTLLDRGVAPDYIVGTSVGAFNGAYLASAPTPAGLRGLEEVWLSVRHDDVFSGGAVGVLLNLVKRHPSLYNGDGIRHLLERASTSAGFSDYNFADLTVPLAVVATNITRGQPAIFDRGPLLPALLASSAIPAILPPVQLDGEQYVDGGLLDNVGLRVAAVRGARCIYVLDTSWEGHAQRPATTLDAVIDRSLQVVMAFHLQCALETYARQAQIVLLRADESLAGSGSDFNHTAQLIQAGREIAERALASPRRESAQAIRRGHTTILPEWVGGRGRRFRAGTRSVREWAEAASSGAHSSFGLYLRQVAQTLGITAASDAFSPENGTLDAQQPAAS